VNERIAQELNKRIAEGDAWLQSGKGLEFPGPELRGQATTIRLVESLDSPKRVERRGFGFLVCLNYKSERFSFRLNVRVKPETREAKVSTSTPYVVVYVPEKESAGKSEPAEDAVIVKHFEKDGDEAALSSFTTPDWYAWFVFRALEEDRGKFFDPDNLTREPLTAGGS
jgi:hypothetical protein